MGKLLEEIDKLDSYVLSDEIVIDKLELFGTKKDVYVSLDDVLDKSFKVFSVGDVVIGYLYFCVDDIISKSGFFFDIYSDDSDTDSLSKIIVNYKNCDSLTIKVRWNSLFYSLDNGYSILLFAGEELDTSLVDEEY